MKEITALAPPTSDAVSVCWENLEQLTRAHVQHFIQQLLEEEITELLGRAKSQRREIVTPPQGGLELETDPEPAPPPVYRNGYGKPRQLSTPCGTLTLQRPRVRGLEARFESQILPLFQRRTTAIGQLLPELYLHGLSSGDFDLALRGLLGEGAPLSASSIQRLKAGWQAEYQTWKERSLAAEPAEQVVYLWVDGIYVKAGLEKEKAALLVAVAALADGRKVVLAVESGARESTERWSAILRDLRKRGMNCPRLVIGDGHLGIWGALANVYPEAGEQRCWNHRQVNVLDRIGKKQQPAAKVWLRQLMYAETRKQAETLKQKFQQWCEQIGCHDAGAVLDEDWDRLVTYYDFPAEHWKHLRTTNPVESPFAAVRLRTTAAKRFKKVENATAVIWKTLLLAETRFRKVTAPELMPLVAEGIEFEDGKRTKCLAAMSRERAAEREWEKVAA